MQFRHVDGKQGCQLAQKKRSNNLKNFALPSHTVSKNGLIYNQSHEYLMPDVYKFLLEN